MIRAGVAAIVMMLALPMFGGVIQWDSLETVRTGATRLNGQEMVQADVHFTYVGANGPAATDWRVMLWINDLGGEVLVNSGWQEYVGSTYSQSISDWGNFDTCYRGTAFPPRATTATAPASSTSRSFST